MKYVMIEIAYYIAGKAKQILGGTLSVNQYKDYVLALLFLKSASEYYYKSNDSFQSDENKPFLRLLVSERSSFDYHLQRTWLAGAWQVDKWLLFMN